SPTSTLFPYTTLFRSRVEGKVAAGERLVRRGRRAAADRRGLEAQVHRVDALAGRVLDHHRARIRVDADQPTDRDAHAGLLEHLRSEEHTSELQSREKL